MANTAAVYNRPVLPYRPDQDVRAARTPFTAGLVLILGLASVVGGVAAFVLRHDERVDSRRRLLQLGDAVRFDVDAGQWLRVGPIALVTLGIGLVALSYLLARSSRAAWVVAAGVVALYLAASITGLQAWSDGWPRVLCVTLVSFVALLGLVLVLPGTISCYFGAHRPPRRSAVVDLRDGATHQHSTAVASREPTSRPSHSSATADEDHLLELRARLGVTSDRD